MARFLSHHANRFDAKGWVSAPAPFRAALARENFEGLFAHPLLESPALHCGGTALLDEINGLLHSIPPCSRGREDLAAALLDAAEILRFDSDGRITLGERMRASTGLQDEAMFVGQGRKFQIWEPNRFAAHLEEAKARVRRQRSEMGAQMTRGARE